MNTDVDAGVGLPVREGVCMSVGEKVPGLSVDETVGLSFITGVGVGVGVGVGICELLENVFHKLLLQH